MHEMSIAHAIVEIVQDHAQRDAFKRVRTVHLSLGVLSHVDPRALEFGFDIATRGTVAEGSKLLIDRPSGSGYCMDCSKTVVITAHGEPCPECNGNKWMLVGGDEMRVLDLEVD